MSEEAIDKDSVTDAIANMNNVNLQEEYSDINKLAKYVKDSPKYTKLVPNKGFSQVAIMGVPEPLKIKFLMSKMTNLFISKDTINNRFTNYLITENGINYINREWAYTLERKRIVNRINFLTSINNPLNLDLDKILLTGIKDDESKISLFMSPTQKTEIKEINDTIGCNTEGSIAYTCLLAGFNNTFGSGKFKCEDTDFIELSCEYYDGKLLRKINNDVLNHGKILNPYIKAGHKYMTLLLDNHNQEKAILSTNLVLQIKKLFEDIDSLRLDLDDNQNIKIDQDNSSDENSINKLEGF